MQCCQMLPNALDDGDNKKQQQMDLFKLTLKTLLIVLKISV